MRLSLLLSSFFVVAGCGLLPTRDDDAFAGEALLASQDSAAPGSAGPLGPLGPLEPLDWRRRLGAEARDRALKAHAAAECGWSAYAGAAAGKRGAGRHSRIAR
jgi:hypothetical protein